MILNIIIFLIYSFIGLTIINFIYWFIMDVILGLEPAWPSDPVHVKLAVLSVILIAVITLFFRKIFYVSLNCERKDEKIIKKEEKVENIKEEKKEEELEIFIDKEIK